MTDKNKYIFWESVITIASLLLTAVLLRRTLSSYIYYIAPGLILSLSLSWLIKGKADRGIRYFINIGTLGVLAWLTYSVLNSSLLYEEVILIVVLRLFCLEALWILGSFAPEFLNYIQMLSIPLFMSHAVWIKNYDALSSVLILGYLFCWLLILKIKFYHFFESINIPQLKKDRSIKLSIIFLAASTLISWLLFSNLLLKKTFEGGLLVSEVTTGSDETSREESQDKEYYILQEKLVEKIGELIPDLQSQDKRGEALVLLSKLINESPYVLEVRSAEEGLLSLFKNPGPGLELEDLEGITILIDKYIGKKIVMNIKKNKDKINSDLKSNSYTFKNRISIMNGLRNIQESDSSGKVNKNGQELEKATDNSPANDRSKKEVKESARNIQEWKVLQIFRKLMSLLKKNINSLSEPGKEEISNLAENIERAENTSEVKEIDSEINRLENKPASPDYKKAMEIAKELRNLKQDMINSKDKTQALDKLEKSPLPRDVIERIRESLEEIKAAQNINKLREEIDKIKDILNNDLDKLPKEAKDYLKNKLESLLDKKDKEIKDVLKESGFEESSQEKASELERELEKIKSYNSQEKIEQAVNNIQEKIDLVYSQGFITNETRDKLKDYFKEIKNLLDIKLNIEAKDTREESIMKENKDFDSKLKSIIENLLSINIKEEDSLNNLREELSKAKNITQVEIIMEGAQKEISSLDKTVPKEDIDKLRDEFNKAAEIKKRLIIGQASYELKKGLEELKKTNPESAGDIDNNLRKLNDASTDTQLQEAVNSLEQYYYLQKEKIGQALKAQALEKLDQSSLGKEIINQIKESLEKIKAAQDINKLREEIDKIKDILNNDLDKLPKETKDYLKNKLESLLDKKDKEAKDTLKDASLKELNKESARQLENALENIKSSDTREQLKGSLNNAQEKIDSAFSQGQISEEAKEKLESGLKDTKDLVNAKLSLEGKDTLKEESSKEEKAAASRDARLKAMIETLASLSRLQKDSLNNLREELNKADSRPQVEMIMEAIQKEIASISKTASREDIDKLKNEFEKAASQKIGQALKAQALEKLDQSSLGKEIINQIKESLEKIKAAQDINKLREEIDKIKDILNNDLDKLPKETKDYLKNKLESLLDKKDKEAKDTLKDASLKELNKESARQLENALENIKSSDTREQLKGSLNNAQEKIDSAFSQGQISEEAKEKLESGLKDTKDLVNAKLSLEGKDTLKEESSKEEKAAASRDARLKAMIETLASLSRLQKDSLNNLREELNKADSRPQVEMIMEAIQKEIASISKTASREDIDKLKNEFEKAASQKIGQALKAQALEKLDQSSLGKEIINQIKESLEKIKAAQDINKLREEIDKIKDILNNDLDKLPKETKDYLKNKLESLLDKKDKEAKDTLKDASLKELNKESARQLENALENIKSSDTREQLKGSLNNAQEKIDSAFSQGQISEEAKEKLESGLKDTKDLVNAKLSLEGKDTLKEESSKEEKAAASRDARLKAMIETLASLSRLQKDSLNNLREELNKADSRPQVEMIMEAIQKEIASISKTASREDIDKLKNEFEKAASQKIGQALKAQALEKLDQSSLGKEIINQIKESLEKIKAAQDINKLREEIDKIKDILNNDLDKLPKETKDYLKNKLESLLDKKDKEAKDTLKDASLKELNKESARQLENALENIKSSDTREQLKGSLNNAQEKIDSAFSQGQISEEAKEKLESGLKDTKDLVNAKLSLEGKDTLKEESSKEEKAAASRDARLKSVIDNLLSISIKGKDSLNNLREELGKADTWAQIEIIMEGVQKEISSLDKTVPKEDIDKLKNEFNKAAEKKKRLIIAQASDELERSFLSKDDLERIKTPLLEIENALKESNLKESDKEKALELEKELENIKSAGSRGKFKDSLNNMQEKIDQAQNQGQVSNKTRNKLNKNLNLLRNLLDNKPSVEAKDVTKEKSDTGEKVSYEIKFKNAIDNLISLGKPKKDTLNKLREELSKAKNLTQIEITMEGVRKEIASMDKAVSKEAIDKLKNEFDKAAETTKKIIIDRPGYKSGNNLEELKKYSNEKVLVIKSTLKESNLAESNKELAGVMEEELEKILSREFKEKLDQTVNNLQDKIEQAYKQSQISNESRNKLKNDLNELRDLLNTKLSIIELNKINEKPGAQLKTDNENKLKNTAVSMKRVNAENSQGKLSQDKPRSDNEAPVIYILPEYIILTKDSSASLKVVAVYSSNLIKEVSPEASWSVSDSRIISIDSKGAIHALFLGSAEIYAEYKGAKSTKAIVVVVNKISENTYKEVKKAMAQ